MIRYTGCQVALLTKAPHRVSTALSISIYGETCAVPATRVASVNKTEKLLPNRDNIQREVRH